MATGDTATKTDAYARIVDALKNTSYHRQWNCESKAMPCGMDCWIGARGVVLVQFWRDGSAEVYTTQGVPRDWANFIPWLDGEPAPAVAEPPARGMTDAEYIAAARDEYEREGEIEIDDGAIVSRGTDPGAYVAAWVWVYDRALDDDSADHSADD